MSERESISRILFLLLIREGNGHSSGRAVTSALKRPNPEGKSEAALARVAGILLFGLAPSGVCPAALIAKDPGELLPHLFTLTGRRDREERQQQKEEFLLCRKSRSLSAKPAVSFLWHFPRLTAGRH